MGLAIILFAGAVVILFWLFLWSFQRQRLGPIPELEPALGDLSLLESSDAVIVATEQGHVLHANETIRRWVGVDHPDLEMIARSVQPVDSFLELFTREGQASFQMSKRWVEATSHRIPSDGMARMVVVMREISNTSASAEALDLSRAIHIANEIGETVNASLGVEPVLQALLTIVRKEIPADAGEICLWDEKQKMLHPRGWTGDIAYVLALSEVGGAYAYGEGISGWIARYRKPVFVSDIDDTTTVRPKLTNGMYRSYIGVPLILGERFMGTLELASQTRFVQGDLPLLQAVSKQVTTAIYNAQLYREQVQRVEDLATVQQVIDQATLEDDPTQVFLALNQRIAQLLDAEVCGVLVYDELRQALVAQPPYYGLPIQLIRNFSIPVPEGSAAYDIWQRQPYWMSRDLAEEPLAEEMRFSVLVNAAGLKDTILMPLQVGSMRIGMIQVSNKRTVGGFSPEDIQNLRLLSAQAAIAVEDMRLAQRQQIHETEMTGLQEITQAFGAISHTDEFYANINERIARLMSLAMCGILIYDERSNRLVAQKPFYGLDDSLIEAYAIELPAGSAMEDIWQQEDYWYTNNVTTDKVVYGAGLAELAALVGVEKTLMAVMASGGRRLGVVQVSNKLAGEDFTDNDARLLLIFAAQVGGMIENARLLREVQDRVDESEGLRRVAEYAGGVMTGADDFLLTLREICRLTNSPSAFINILDPQTGNLIRSPKYSYGVASAAPFVFDAYSKGYEQSVAVSRRPFLSNDVRNDTRTLPDYRKAAVEIGIMASVVVPLIVGDQSLGELGVFNRSEPPYGDADTRNLQAIAIHVAAALDRVRLQEATGQNLRRRLQELDAISRVSNELASTLELDRVLDVIRQEATQATDAEGNSIVLLLPATEWSTPEQPRVERRIGGDRQLLERKSMALVDIELQAVRQGAEPFVVEDYQQQTYRAIPDTARSAVAASFLYEDRIVGVIHLYHSEPFHFDERAATFLMTLAAKASLSYGNNLRYLENQERSDRLRRRVEQLNQIFELGQMLQSNVDTGTILEAIAFSVQTSIGFDVVMLMMTDEDAGILRRVAQAGLPIDVFEESKKNILPIKTLENLFQKGEFRISESYFLPLQQAAQWYVEGLEVISTGQAVTRTLHPHSKDDWHDGDMLIVPLFGAGGNLLGLMSLDRPFNDRRPDRNTIEILEIFAHQAAATLENTRLYMTTVRNAEQEARLNEVMEAIASTLDMGEIIETVARGVLRLLPFMHMTVALLESEQQGFDMVTVTVKADESLVTVRDHRANLNNTALMRTFEEGKDYLYDYDDPDDYDDLKAWHVAGERTTLIVPLITGGICLGAMHLGSDLTKAFGFEEFRPLIKRIANLSAVAIQNANLFNQAVNLRLFNESVVESIQQGIIVLDNAERIITVNDFMRKLGWTDAARKLLFEYRPSLKPLIADIFKQVVADGEPQELLNQTVIEAGQRLMQNFYLYPLRSANNVRGIVVLIDDVTERTRLEQDLASRANQLTALTEISSRITAALDRDEVVELAMDEMQRVIDYDVMSLWRREGDDLVLEATRGFEVSEGEQRIAIQSHERLKQVVESRRAVSIQHFQGRDLLPGESGLQSWLAAPLVRQRDVIGVIALGKRSATFYDKQAEQAMFAFANQVAVALVNADLFQETGARTERLSLLNRVSIALAQSLDTENIMEIALREIALLLRIEKARAYIFERDTNAARVVVEYPRGDAPPINIIDLRGSAVFEHVIRTSAPLVIGDVSLYEGDEAVRQEIQRQAFTAYVVIPLTVGGQVSGVVELEVYNATRQFEPEKLELSTIIANQAAIAVLNANLLEQTLVRTRELETLLEAAQATSYTLDLDEVFSSVVRLALQALDMDDGSIMLYDNVDESLKVELDMNRQGDRNRITPSGTIYDLNLYPAKSRALREGQIIVIKQEDTEADMKELAEMAESKETARMLVPLIVRDQSIGLLQIELQSQLRTFTHREIRMAQALGAQAATAIENARLSTQTSLLVEQSLVINDISRTISSTMNTDDMIDIVRQQIPSLTDAEEIFVALYNPLTDEIRFPLALKGGRDVVMPPRKMGEDEFSFVLRSRRPVAMGGDNPTAAEVRRNLKIVTDVDASRFLGVPLMAGDQIAGVLAVRDTKQTRPFGLNDNRILTTIAAQLGATLQNALLFERVRNFAAELNTRVEERTVELQEERDRLNSLYQITAELGRTLDTDRVLARALEMVARVIGADEGIVLLIDAQTDQLYSRSILGQNALPASNGNHGAQRAHPALKLGNWLIEHERSLLVDDLSEADYWDKPTLWRSAIGVVLETNEDVQGVMIFLGRERSQFSDPQLKLVIAAANQVAAAVNNADLYNLIREQNDRMATLLRTEQEEAEKNSAILEGIADGVLLADASGVVVLFNSAAETILGLPRRHALGLPLSKIAEAYGGTAQWVRALDAWVMNPRRDGESELLLDRLEVGSRVVSVHASPVFISEQFLGTVSVFRDVTRDVEVDRMKSEFISNVSHELRTPMTSIKGYADLLIGGTAGDITEVQKRFLGTIKGNADRLADLVNDLLNISRIDSGRERLKLENVQLGEVFQQVISSLEARPQFEAKQIRVTTEIDPDVQAIKADHLKLVQILTNLVDNAFNYTYPGGKIEIAAQRRASNPANVVISIKDSGIGIPEEFRSRIWNRFERYEEHALVMEVAGTGLGLSIVKTLVEMHNGEVWFESEENKGTTFYVSLPVEGPEQVQITSEQTVEG